MSDTEQPSRFLNDEWVAYLDDSGEEYYYNLFTAETTWDLPDIGDKTCDVTSTEAKDAVQPEVSKTEISPASHDSATRNNEQLEPAAENNEDTTLSVPVQPSTPVNEPPSIANSAPEVAVSEKNQSKPQKPPKALKALLVAKSATKIDPASASNEDLEEVKAEAGALAPKTSTDDKCAETNAEVALANEEKDATAAEEPANESGEPLNEGVDTTEVALEGAAVELETVDVTSTTVSVSATEVDTVTVSSEPTTQQPAPVTDTNKPPTSDTVDEVVKNGASEVSTTNNQESPSALHARVTSTGKVSALAKMFSSRPNSSNNMKSTDALSPRSDSASPVRSPSGSAKNAGLWGPSVRNKSSFVSKSPQKTSSSGSVLFMTPSSPKSKGKRSVSQGDGQEVSTETKEPSAEELVEAVPLTSSKESLTVPEGKDYEGDVSTNELVQPAVAVKVKPPRPPPPTTPRPPSVKVHVVVVEETTEPVTEDQEEVAVKEASGACEEVQSEDPSVAFDSTEKQPTSDDSVGAGTATPIVHVEAESTPEESAHSPESGEATSPPVLQRAASAPVEHSPAVGLATNVPPTAAVDCVPDPVPFPAKVERSASMPESVPAKVKPPKPPKTISAKATTTAAASPAGDGKAVIEAAATATAVTVPPAMVPPEPVANSTVVEEPVGMQTEGVPVEETVIPPPSPSSTAEGTYVVEKCELNDVPVDSTVKDAPPVVLAAMPTVAPALAARIKTRKYEDASDSDSDYGEIELEVLPSETPPDEVLVTSETKQDDVVTPMVEEVEVKVEPEPAVLMAVEMTEVKSEAVPVVAEAPRLTAQIEVPVETSISTVSPPKKPTVAKPPKPVKRVPPASPVVAAAVVSVDPTVPAGSTVSVEQEANKASSAAEPPPPPPRDTETTPATVAAAGTVTTSSAAIQSSEVKEHTDDANLAAELAALEIEVDLSDNIEIGSDSSSVSPARHAAELKAALEAIEILGEEIELVETEEMVVEDEYSSSREKHESLHLPPPPSLSPPPPPVPVHLHDSPSGIKASFVANPFGYEEESEEETAEVKDEVEELDHANHHAVAVNGASLAVDYAYGTPNAPGTGKIGAGRSIGTWNSHPTPTDATGSGTGQSQLQRDTAQPIPASGKRAIGQWDQHTTVAPPPTVCEPPVTKESAFSTHPATNPPHIPTAKAIPSYSPPAVPAVPAPVAAVAVSSAGRSIGAWGGASPLTAPVNDVNPRYTQHRATTSSSGTTSREASPAPGARQMSPLLAIALSKKAEAARNRSPQPMQSASRNSSVGEFDNDFDGFDGGRASDVHSIVGYKGVPITHGHSHLKNTFGGPSAVGGSMGSPYNSPEGSARDDAPVGYLQRTNTGQVRKRNPRPSEVLTGLDEGMEALNSIVLKKLMRIGVKYLPAKEALQRCVSNTSAVNHYYNALSLVRTSMLAGLGMDPYGAQLWSPRITSRIKSWLPNLLDGETKDFHTGYIMLVSYQRLADNQLISWQLTLRYSVFRNLNTKIAKYIAGTSMDSRVHFPSKVTTFFTGITDKVRNERMNQLDLWMREILNSALIMTIPEVADALLEVLEVESRVSD